MNARQGGFYQILGEIRMKKYFMIAAMVVSAAVMSACGNKTANNQRETPVKNIVIENTGNTVDKKNPEDISNRAGGAKETGNPEDISNRAGGAGDAADPEDISNRAGGAGDAADPEDISNRAGGAGDAADPEDIGNRAGGAGDAADPEDIGNRAGGAGDAADPEDISNRAGGAKDVLGQVKVTADSLNVRSWASTSSQILAVAGAGQVFDYTEELDEWYCVQGTVDGVPVTGYIWKAYSSPML